MKGLLASFLQYWSCRSAVNEGGLLIYIWKTVRIVPAVALLCTLALAISSICMIKPNSLQSKNTRLLTTSSYLLLNLPPKESVGNRVFFSFNQVGTVPFSNLKVDTSIKHWEYVIEGIMHKFIALAKIHIHCIGQDTYSLYWPRYKFIALAKIQIHCIGQDTYSRWKQVRILSITVPHINVSCANYFRRLRCKYKFCFFFISTMFE